MECHKWMTGGINRLKYHLARIPGQNVEGFPKTTPKIIREMKALLAEYELNKDERQKTKDVLR